jgi:hypothetical protein
VLRDFDPTDFGFGVKSGKAQPEQMSSASPPEADVPGDHLQATSLRTGRHRGLAALFGQHLRA